MMSDLKRNLTIKYAIIRQYAIDFIDCFMKVANVLKNFLSDDDPQHARSERKDVAISYYINDRCAGEIDVD